MALKSVFEFYHLQEESTVLRDLNHYKIVVPLFGATYAAPNNMLHQIKASQFYTNFLILISLVMHSNISEVEFLCVNKYFS